MEIDWSKNTTQSRKNTFDRPAAKTRLQSGRF